MQTQRKTAADSKLNIWLPLLFALIMVVGMFLGFKIKENTQSVKSFFKLPGKRSPLQEVMDLITYKYVDNVDLDTLGNEAIVQTLKRLDPHSVFIPAVELSEVNEDLQGNFQGIGIEFQIFNDTVNVVSVLPDGPSDKAGLQVGDKFLKVGDSVVVGNHIDNVRIKKLLRGPGSSNAKVLILRDTKQQEVNIKRGNIPLYAVDAAYMINSNTGFIRINRFSENTYEEFMQATEKLLKAGMKSMILDLRGNGGGILGEAVDIADEFLDGDKLIVYTEGAHAKKQEYNCKRPGQFEKGNLAVLVDENSASASEVLTGALQDWDRATIIGRRTFGKGLVQEQYDLSDGSALRLTIARYFTPSGRSIQKPYDHNGNDDYKNDIEDRIKHGELINADSNKVDKGKAYKTKSGRTVYGGGGIMPDVFVSFDTNRLSKAVMQVYSTNTINNFVYTYYLQNKTLLKKFSGPVDFAKNFTLNEIGWNSFVNTVAKDSIDMRSINLADKQFLEQRLKASIARYIWRNEGYFEVLNVDDTTVQKALEKVK